MSGRSLATKVHHCGCTPAHPMEQSASPEAVTCLADLWRPMSTTVAALLLVRWSKVLLQMLSHVWAISGDQCPPSHCGHISAHPMEQSASADAVTCLGDLRALIIPAQRLHLRLAFGGEFAVRAPKSQRQGVQLSHNLLQTCWLSRPGFNITAANADQAHLGFAALAS